jgi:hypothetical protein
MNRELRNILKANINFATMLCLGAPTTELPRKREPASHRVKCAQGLARQDFL